MAYLRKIIFASLFLMAQFSFSQVSKFSLEANFPIPTGNSFFGKHYNGIVDIGAKYRVVDLSNINLGISVNGGYFTKNGSRFQVQNPYGEFEIGEDPDVTNFTILPKIFAELDTESLPKLHPFVGVGYGFLLFNAASHSSSPSDSETKNGLNINFGVYYLIIKNVFAQVQYDYVKLSAGEEIMDTSFNTNVSIIKFGLGIML
jgi:opacity protein-like surface antigen